MTRILNTHFKTWWTLMLRPIYFYARLKEEDWKGAGLTFLLINSWLLALIAALVIFVIQYIPIGSTLVAEVAGAKFIIVLPVLLALAFVFFLITFLILGGTFVVGFFAAFYVLGWLMHLVYTYLFGKKGSLNQMIQGSFYSSGVILSGGLIFGLMILTKYAGLSFELFRYGYNSIYFFTCLYAYGLWAVAGRKTYQAAKWQAFAGALVPLAALLIFGVLFDKMALSKLAPWIM
ncbi:MAG: hypothetical protein JW782_07280 [Candidatus Saganbacteria bacterium]|nr:hypothetical protein [Candidatus Saganbacteria bacterium]